MKLTKKLTAIYETTEICNAVCHCTFLFFM